MSKRHPIQINETLWERLQLAAAKESVKQKKIVTAAEYVRQILTRSLNRKGIK